MTPTLPVFGDKISSSEFAFGIKSHGVFRNNDEPIIYVDGVTTTAPMEVGYSEAELVAYIQKHAQMPTTRKVVDYGAYDEGRGSAIFVVEDVKFEGDSQGWVNHNDPNLVVFARRLHPDGKYNTQGELIFFCFNNSNSRSIKNLTIHGHMQVLFI